MPYVLAIVLWSVLVAEEASPGPELVMTPGCEITTRTPGGMIKVTAGEVVPPGKDMVVKTDRGPVKIRATELYRRTYYWGDHCKGSVDLEPRNLRRFGSLGIYSPGTGFHWPECEGVARAVVEEGQQRFDTVDQAMEWLKARSRWVPYVYRNDGLAVGWRTVIPHRKQLEVRVWQLFIGGKKPTSLPGADDNGILSNCP